MSLAEQDLNVQKWSILWRTIILAALGKTMYPYCKYIRVFDLRDLANLLDDDKFRGKIAKQFFSEDLARFHYTVEFRGRASRLDIKRITAAIGDEITQQAPLLESLEGPSNSTVLTESLATWAPRLSHLQSLTLWDTKALEDESLRNLLHAHCPKLESLTLFHSTSDDPDHILAAFIGGMQNNTMKQFENHSNCGIGPETCLALNNHGSSLRQLKLALTGEGVLALGCLQGCTAVEKLQISSLRASVDLKATQNDIFLEIVEWIRNCTLLKELSFQNMLSAPDLAMQALLNKELAINELDINSTKDEEAYNVKDHHDFHKALEGQSSLRRLLLRADPDPMGRDDVETLMNTFCSLTGLQELKLIRISDYFSDVHINLLVQHLPELEDIYIGGYGISDAVLPSVAKLKKLKAATFSGITEFTAEGILDFIEMLGPGNKSFTLSVDNASPDSGISPEKQEWLRERMMAKVDGRFEYQLLRGKTGFFVTGAL